MTLSLRTLSTLSATALLVLAAGVPTWAQTLSHHPSPGLGTHNAGAPPSWTPTQHATQPPNTSSIRPPATVRSTPVLTPSSFSAGHSPASFQTKPGSPPSQASKGLREASHHGASENVLHAVSQLHVLQHEVQQARLAYIDALKSYLQTLSHVLSTANPAAAETAVKQLAAINVTLAHAVQTEKAAHLATATSSSGATGALSTVLERFHAELAALTDATHQVDELTAKLASVVSTSGSPSVSRTATESPS